MDIIVRYDSSVTSAEKICYLWTTFIICIYICL